MSVVSSDNMKEGKRMKKGETSGLKDRGWAWWHCCGAVSSKPAWAK